ncbi:MAG TPA: hypothetical protein VMH49_03985 [Thermoplasmata archaeon]|nr:hypothetical protein [Thermoplasmata archaeon]
MREKDDGVRPRRRSGVAPRYRRPPAEEVSRAARRAVRGGRASFGSLAEFRSAVLNSLRRDEPLATVGGERLRRLLVGVGGVRLSVHYTERANAQLPDRCPVCRSELTPIRNRTLTGETIDLGRKCSRCDYWTHAARRVPVRYIISRAGGPEKPRTKAVGRA